MRTETGTIHIARRAGAAVLVVATLAAATLTGCQKQQPVQDSVTIKPQATAATTPASTDAPAEEATTPAETAATQLEITPAPEATEAPSAQTNTKIKRFTVTFVDYDGTVLDTQTVKKGKNAKAPKAPKHEHLTFAGWDRSFKDVNSDLIITATYEEATIYVESVTVKKGAQEVDVNIRVANNPGIMGAVLQVSVDDQVFALNGSYKTEYPGLTLTTSGPGVKTSPYTCLLDALEISEADKKDGTLFTLTFKIKDTDKKGTFAVTLACKEGAVFDENQKDVPLVLQNGTITIK